MNLDVALCIENAINRAWEPHKYESKELQDKKLENAYSMVQAIPRKKRRMFV